MKRKKSYNFAHNKVYEVSRIIKMYNKIKIDNMKRGSIKATTVLCVLVIWPFLTIGAVNDNPEETYYTYVDGFYFSLNEASHTATVQPKSSTSSLTPSAESANYSGRVNIPERVMYNDEPYIVNSIGRFAFTGCIIDSLIIPESIKEIDGDPMGTIDCVFIDSWEWWNNITTSPHFNEYTGTDPNSEWDVSFSNLLNAKHVYVGGVEVDMENLSLPEGLTELRDYAFMRCNNIKSLSLQGTLTAIGRETFRGCENLEIVNIADNVTKIGIGCFQNCHSMEELFIGNGITTIPEKAFDKSYGGNGLKLISLGQNLRSIKCSFSVAEECRIIVKNMTAWCEDLGIGCFNTWGPKYRLYKDVDTELTDIIIPEGVESIRANCFCNVVNIKSVTMPKSMMSIGEMAFYHCPDLADVSMEDGVESIGAYAFSLCNSLSEMTIGDGVVSISTSAFNGCESLTTLKIGELLETIESKAFAGCEALRSIVSRIKKPWPFDDNVFTQDVYRNASLYVPTGSRDYYIRMDGWRNFFDILETGEILGGDVNNDGKVGVGDIVAVTNLMAGTTVNEAMKARADVNGDGEVGIGDIVAITNIMAGNNGALN